MWMAVLDFPLKDLGLDFDKVNLTTALLDTKIFHKKVRKGERTEMGGENHCNLMDCESLPRSCPKFSSNYKLI